MPKLSTKYILSNGCTERGAYHGRGSFVIPEITGTEFRVNLWHEKLVDGGYDSGGAYWGARQPGYKLYMAQAPGIFFACTARYREEAADQLRAYVEKHIPGAKVRIYGIPLE